MHICNYLVKKKILIILEEKNLFLIESLPHVRQHIRSFTTVTVLIFMKSLWSRFCYVPYSLVEKLNLEVQD